MEATRKTVYIVTLTHDEATDLIKEFDDNFTAKDSDPALDRLYEALISAHYPAGGTQYTSGTTIRGE